MKRVRILKNIRVLGALGFAHEAGQEKSLPDHIAISLVRQGRAEYIENEMPVMAQEEDK